MECGDWLVFFVGFFVGVLFAYGIHIITGGDGGD